MQLRKRAERLGWCLTNGIELIPDTLLAE